MLMDSFSRHAMHVVHGKQNVMKGVQVVDFAKKRRFHVFIEKFHLQSSYFSKIYYGLFGSFIADELFLPK